MKLFSFIFWKIFSLDLSCWKHNTSTQYLCYYLFLPVEEKAQIFVCFSLFIYPQYGTWASFEFQLVFVEWLNEWMRQLEWMNKEQEWRHAYVHFQKEEEVFHTIAPSSGAGRPGVCMELQYQLSQAPVQAYTHVNHYFHLSPFLVDSAPPPATGSSHLPFHRKAVNQSYWEEAVLKNTCILVLWVPRIPWGKGVHGQSCWHLTRYQWTHMEQHVCVLCLI